MRSFGSSRMSLRRYLYIAGAIAAMTLADPAFAAEKPPLAPEQDSPLVV